MTQLPFCHPRVPGSNPASSLVHQIRLGGSGHVTLSLGPFGDEEMLAHIFPGKVMQQTPTTAGPRPVAELPGARKGGTKLTVPKWEWGGQREMRGWRPSASMA